ncbi:hypothetical protein [Tateyamaria sp. syn59]|uniref:hypothetical protein n=1 Tax=Tateyamaria sp. syn59 TaxID=2576942 RepID=UPI0011BDCA5B|nr:hypothetical protein [Tateyamaria sp. syn59]
MQALGTLPCRGQHWITTRIDRHPTRWRWILAGPTAFILSILAMAGLPTVLPAGAGGVNHLVLPVVLFPLLWSSFIVWPVASTALPRVATTYLALGALLLTLITLSFLT